MSRRVFFSLITIASLFSSCIDNAVVDQSFAIPNRNWTYVNKISVPVKITDPSKNYTLFLNLRHTADYRYSNIFVLFHVSGPSAARSTERKEFRLAYPDGEWLGSGSGNLFNYQLPLEEHYKFPSRGTYTIEVEHNMRDNPLREISDAGIRVAPEE